MKVFGYPPFDENGQQILTTYDNEYSAMMMDIRVFRLRAGQQLELGRPQEETAALLLSGSVRFDWDGRSEHAQRENVFCAGPYCLHLYAGADGCVAALTDAEVLVQRTHNQTAAQTEFYRPADAPWRYSCRGQYGNTANRRVNTIFDHEIAPHSNMVLGEVLNDPGNWSGYLPHSHPQPETYYFKFDRPEGFGASFVGDEVFKSVDGSFSAIPGGRLHPQSAAPGFVMYTCWMIRHLEGNPWNQTDRNEDPRYLWMHDAQF
jgi:5-deoxy-glucuronate isomerase